MRVRSFASIAVAALLAPAAFAQDLYDETVLRTLKLTFAQGDWWQQLLNNRLAGTNLAATLEVDGRVYPGVGVRFKGNAAFDHVGASPKKPFKIEVDWTVQDQDLYGQTSINLNNGFRDPTFLREVAMAHYLRSYVPAPRANFVKLVINSESWGVYVNVEQIDKRFMDRWFEARDGNRYKGDASTGAPVGGTALTWLGNSTPPYELSYELKTRGNPNVWTDLIGICDVLNNTPTSQFGQTLDPLFSVDRALWYMAGCNVFVALDSYIGAGHNFYLLVDDEHARMSITPWDLGESFGAFGDGQSVGRVKIIEPDYNFTHPFRPLIGQLLREPRIRNRYNAHLRTLLDEVFDWATIGPKLTEYRNLIRAEVAADQKKLYTLAMFDQNFTQDVTLPGAGRAGGTVPGLRSLVDTRRSFLQSHASLQQSTATIANVSHSPPDPTERDAVTVTATVQGAATVSLYHRVRGAFLEVSMQDDGQHGDGAASDGVFGATIAAQLAGARVEYYVGAEASGGGARFEPRNAEHAPFEYVVRGALGTSARINEFMALNGSTIRDPAGEADDWVELENPKPTPVDVGGMYLSDRRDDPTKWRIPAGTVLQPGATLLIWADDDASQGPFHATFRLSASGEDLVLTDRDGSTTLDVVSFDQQQQDVSQGRAPNGGDVWVKYLDPSPGAGNGAAPCGGRRYAPLDLAASPGGLALSGAMRIGTNASFSLSGLGATRPVAVLLSVAPAHVPLGFDPAVLLIALPVFTIASGATAPNGSASLPFPIPNDASLVGREVYEQAFSLGAGVLTASGGLMTAICR